MVNSMRKESNHSRYERPKPSEAATDETGDNDRNSYSGYGIERLFEGNSSKFMKEFRAMILWENLQKAIVTAQKIIEHLELKGIKKGSTTKEYKFNKLEQRWF